MNTKTVFLSAPIAFGSKEINIEQMVFRQPKMSDVIKCGDPSILTRSADGAVLVIENMDAIAAYARELLIEPFGQSALIDHLALPDALAVRDAVTDFFSEARRTTSAAGSASSSANSDGSAAPSSAP
ncbi:MAG: hypothetical protein QHC89_02580 [Bosea sp. (in: a-proteobacteria)]|nr:hypothetical protein [Bosea sp. (in: a-proteobacteria)]